jgi:hypothetical protein
MESNRKVLRQYIRKISVAKNIDDIQGADYFNAELAIKYFVILHNFLLLEDMHYDQAIMAKSNINKHLNLKPLPKVRDIMTIFYRVYNHGSKVRCGLEGLKKVEEVALLLKHNPHIYNKLKI